MKPTPDSVVAVDARNLPCYFSWAYAGLGEKEKAIAYLEKEYKEGAYNLSYLKTDPQLDSLRSDLRFAELLRRLKLAP
jgi:hypothetical protein